jgi:hypothetical protein
MVMLERFPVPAFQGVHFKALRARSGNFPSSRIQKGLILCWKDLDLSEEGVGFGMPVLKLGAESIFPGSWEMSVERCDGRTLVKAEYTMNLVARMSKGDNVIKNHVFCLACNLFSKIHRDQPKLRESLSNLSGILRQSMGLKDAFCEISSPGSVSAAYLIAGSKVYVFLKFPQINGCTEKIVLNELGANWFDTYTDSEGCVLKGNEIGSWDEIFADEATFLDPADELSFALKAVSGARMFRGRELVPDRLAWSGLAYVLPPQRDELAYSITIGRT